MTQPVAHQAESTASHQSRGVAVDLYSGGGLIDDFIAFWGDEGLQPCTGWLDSSLISEICRPRVGMKKGEGRGLSQREGRFMK